MESQAFEQFLSNVVEVEEPAVMVWGCWVVVLEGWLDWTVEAGKVSELIVVDGASATESVETGAEVAKVKKEVGSEVEVSTLVSVGAEVSGSGAELSSASFSSERLIKLRSRSRSTSAAARGAPSWVRAPSAFTSAEILAGETPTLAPRASERSWGIALAET